MLVVGTTYKVKLKGVAMVEMAMLMPIVFLFFTLTVFFVSFLHSKNVLELASFYSARASQVYGNQKIKSINYPFTANAPYTNNEHSIAEAAAERIIFESMLWEQGKIKITKNPNSLDRVYLDSNQELYEGQTPSDGSVVVRFNGCASSSDCITTTGTTTYYCLPIVFKTTQTLFKGIGYLKPCTFVAHGKTHEGLWIQSHHSLTREPIEP